MTFDATLNPVVYEGGIPVFIDTEYDSWNMDPVALEKAFELYPDVKLVVSAELYGFPGDIKKIKEICGKHGALLIEDAAESMGATWDGVQCGTCLLLVLDLCYHVVIKSNLFSGSLSYGELLIPGKSDKEIFLSTYVCHPSMANNELSGPVVQLQLAKWLLAQKERKYSYRLVWIPETIGSITYLSRHLEEMKKKVIAGYVLTCVGDERAISYSVAIFCAYLTFLPYVEICR